MTQRGARSPSRNTDFPNIRKKGRKVKGMMMPRNGFINLKNSEVTSYLKLKKGFVKFLLDNGYQLYADFDSDRAVVYASEGNDLEHMTFKQLSRRTMIK